MVASVVTTFESNGLDGWSMVGLSTLEWRPEGGNPGAYAHWTDDPNGDYAYYNAAEKYLGDKSAYYGGAISYDIENSGADFTAPDIKLSGGGLTLVIARGQAGTDWTHFSAKLDDTAGWRVDTLGGAVATAAQIQQVLASLGSLQIRAEYKTGAEEGGLDSVVLSGPATSGFNVYDTPAEQILLGNYARFDDAQAAASPGNEIAQVPTFLATAIGTITVDNLTYRASQQSIISDFTLASNVVTFTARGSGEFRIADNAKNNFITVSGGISTIYAGLGNDTIDGTGSNAVVDYSTNTRSMVIDLAKTGPQATAGFGSDTLIGISSVTSGSGNDRLYGNDGANDLIGNGGIDRLFGRGGKDRLNGGDGSDFLDGGAGADQMYGSIGADTYYVDDSGDMVIDIDTISGQADDGAIDKVISTISYTLGDYIENLTLTGTDNLNGTGNSLNNTITGNNGDNVLDGGDGNDRLVGGLGNDTLRGGKGTDTLTGGVGVDDMDGGEDGDTYYVASNDNVHDSGTTGTDRVIALGAWTSHAGDGIERIDTQSTGDVALTGNELDNSIYGGDGANTLKGLAGSDTLHGGGGADRLEGGAGRDFLYGDAGGDTFVFKAGDAGATATTFDIVKDFVGTDGDKIDLDVVTKALTDGQYAERTVTSDAYSAAYNAAVAAMSDGDHTAVFVAGTTNGYLFWNTDSNPTTPDQSVRLDGVNNIALFDKSFIV